MRALLLDPLRLNSLSDSAFGEQKLLLQTGLLAGDWNRGMRENLDDIDFSGPLGSFYCRELLLLDPGDRLNMFKALCDALSDYQPFPTAGVLFSDLVHQTVAMVLFPLSGSAGDPPSCGIYAAWEGGEAIVLCEGVQMTGQSFSVARELARRCFAADASTRIDLAAKWMVTGNLKQPTDTIHRVGMGNKLHLHCADHRTWILPAALFQSGSLFVPDDLRYCMASTVQDALAHIRGEGATEGGVESWPENISLFHSFTSEAYSPLILAAIFTRPSRITLWHSAQERSRTPAKRLAPLLERKLDCLCTCSLLSSSSLAQAERTLWNGVKTELETGESLMFNITQGNLLMRLAAVQIARRYPNLHLIYKDRDNDARSFTVLQFPGSEPVTRIFVGETTFSGVRWDALFSFRRENILETTEALEKKFFKKSGNLSA